MSFTTATARWAALTTRNRQADGAFIYGVHTTKIYCRPSCPARLARRANVTFFDTPSSASQAGYRPCKRCKPDSIQPQPDPQEQAVRKACAIIRDAMTSSEHVNGHIGLNELAERVDLTPSYLHKTFKARVGCTPKAYAAKLRGREEGGSKDAERHEPLSLLIDSNAPFATADGTAPAFDFDFNFSAASSVDALSDPTGLAACGLSEATTSINTPMTTTTDFPWLDNTTGSTTFECCELFDAEALARQMLELDEAALGWNNDEAYLRRSNTWDDNLLVAGGGVTEFQVFDLDGGFGSM